MRTARQSMFVLLALAVAPLGLAQNINVGTDSSVTLSYYGNTQTVGPFPWSDLGINATASITPGDVTATTAGSSSFSLNSAFTPGQQISVGTPVNLGYENSWTGSSLAQNGATGSVNSNFVYNIGPISGSSNLLNVPVSGNSFSTPNLSGALANTPSTTVGGASGGTGPSNTVGYTLAAQGCVFVCVTVASASIGVTVGSQVQQSVSATPTVTYGNLVWYSTDGKYSASDPQAFVAGSGGAIANQIGNLSALGLTNGQRIYYNVLPEVQLSMPVTAQAELDLPASITASFNVLGVGGSKSFPLGNLYSLSTGAASYDINETFHNNDYYTVPLNYEACNNYATACINDAVVAGDYAGKLSVLGNGDVPSGGPCGAQLIGCTLTVPSTPGSIGGYGLSGLGPLIPGDPSTSDVCLGNGQCINHVVLKTTMDAPEIDSANWPAALTLLVGCLAVARGGRSTDAARSTAQWVRPTPRRQARL